MFYFNNLVRDVKKEISHYLLDNICKDLPKNITKFIFDMVWGILSSGTPRCGQGGTFMSKPRKTIPEEERKELLNNPYIFDVTTCNIYFNKEGKKFIYEHLSSEMSITKTLLTMGIKLTPIIESRKNYIRNSIMKEGKGNPSFERKHQSSQKPLTSTSDDQFESKRIKELEDKLVIKEQELLFLKKLPRRSNR